MLPKMVRKGLNGNVDAGEKSKKGEQSSSKNGRERNVGGTGTYTGACQQKLAEDMFSSSPPH